MVAIPVLPVKVSVGGGMDLQNYKLALSLHDMLGSGQMQTAAPGLLGPVAQTPSERPSAGSSESGADDDGASLAKRSFQPYHSQSVPKSENLEAHASECASNGTPITTVMLRNIPNKYTQNSLLKEINDLGFATTYDFFYLPMDVHNRSNVGYAFINFQMPKDAERFRRVFSDHRFQRFHSRKIGSVCVAHVQGLDANLRHFENRAVTQARNDQYRPIVLQGQQRIGFDHAVLLAKAKDGTPQDVSSAAGAGAAKASAGEEDPRQGLEAAIRELLSKRAAPAQDAGVAAGELRAAAVGQRACGGGKTNDQADIAHLLSLKNLLISQLHTSKEDGPAYVNPSSLGLYSSRNALAPTCSPSFLDKEPWTAAWQY